MIYHFDELEFKPVSVGAFVHRDGFFDVKARPYASFSFRTKGTGDFEINGKRYATKAGDVLFVPPYVPYKVEYSGSESIVAHLSGCNYPEAECIVLQGHAPRIENCFQRLLTAWNDRHSVNQAKSVLYEILEAISEDQKNETADAVFAACVAYIHEHFCDPDLDVTRICEHGFVSVSGLQRKFQKHFEMSPKQYLIRLRMNRALELLIADELSVREIAYACGFSGEKYFSRAFKQRYGHPPSRL